MPQSLTKVLVHIVFSTKKRIKFLTEELQGRLYPYITICLKNQDCLVHTIGGTENHIHILCELSKTMPICKTVEKIKTSSSIAIKKMAYNMDDFHWQDGCTLRTQVSRVVGSKLAWVMYEKNTLPALASSPPSGNS